ncbi:MAG: DUF5686 and carboxypeptidase regulatory-like domain-containing protein [Ferruginibacter sp.]
MKLFTTLFFLFTVIQSDAQKIFGIIYDDNGDLLPYASVTIKGTSSGASANNKGKFSFNVAPGTYTLVCQHIGYTSSEKTVTVKDDTEVTFILSRQKYTMKEVVVKSGGEDPAYEIIRQAIRKRSYYNEQVKGFNCDLYSKDIIKLRNLPDKLFGQKIPTDDRKEMGLDSTGKGIIYLSESVSKVYTEVPDKFKMEVISSRVSGTESFGFTFPAFISLYKNNVTVFTEKFNPRGFISPIADGALKYYKYKFMGSFIEDGKIVNAIKVIPRRTYEPLFSGTINITDGDWRIQSFDLLLTKTAQLEIMDTLQIRQLHVPVGNDVWRVKNQLLYFNFKMFKIDAIGNFQTVYSGYQINPVYEKKVFDRIFIRYDTAVNKRSKAYWDSIRPVPLEWEEKRDYQFKDSMYQLNKDSMFSSRDIDSLKKRQGKIKPLKIFMPGIHRTHYSKTNTYRWGIEPLLLHVNYNTAEGLVPELAFYYEKYMRKSRTRLLIEPTLRYGFSNTHLNAWMTVTLQARDARTDRKIKRETWQFGGGKRVSQFNKDNPIQPWVNSIGTLLYGDNYMKIYENYYGSASFNKKYESGFGFTVNALFEDRIPLNNTTTFTFKDTNNFQPNYPVERIAASEWFRHQAFTVGVEMSFRPGQRYIQLPRTKIPIGSRYPTFTLAYTKGINGIFGSDVDFDKWAIGVYDDKNLKLAGTLKYKFGVGGFLNTRKLYIQDYQHFNGNQLRAASAYVNSFQLAEYYANSTTANIYGIGHIEHHLNGLLTNKIPLFKRLNWNLVVGGNAFYVNEKNNYSEVFVGLENILKIFRVDLVGAYENGKTGKSGIRIGAGGLLGGSVSRDRNASVER